VAEIMAELVQDAERALAREHAEPPTAAAAA
jgi:hypothetical protein